jgi:hypothetical protein
MGEEPRERHLVQPAQRAQEERETAVGYRYSEEEILPNAGSDL